MYNLKLQQNPFSLIIMVSALWVAAIFAMLLSDVSLW